MELQEQTKKKFLHKNKKKLLKELQKLKKIDRAETMLEQNEKMDETQWNIYRK